MIKKMLYVPTMEYCSALKKKEILPYGTTRMNLKDIMLSKIRQSQNNTTWFYLFEVFKIVKLINAETEW